MSEKDQEAKDLQMTEYDTPERCSSPLSDCCGYPPGPLGLCGNCKEHCGWFDELEEIDDE